MNFNEQIFDNNSLVMFIVNPFDTKILEANYAAERYYGWSREQLKNMKLVDLVEQNEKVEFEEFQILRSLKSENVESRHRLVNGVIRDVEVRSCILRSGNQDVHLLIVLDVSEKRLVQAALKKSEQRFRSLIENSPVAIGISQNGITTYVNEAYLTLFGYQNVKELIGRSLLEQIAPCSREFILENIARRNKGDKVEITYEVWGLKKDATQFPLQIDVTVIESSEGLTAVGFLKDITRQKAAELAMVESEQKYRNIFENATEGIFQILPDGKFVKMNPAAAEIFGFASPEELIHYTNNCTTSLYVCPDERNSLLNKIKADGIVKNIEIRMRKKDSSLIWVSFNVHVVKNCDGEIEYFEGTFRDISLQKHAEAALSQSQELLRATFDSTIDLIWSVDVNTFGLLTFNNSLRQYYLEQRGISIKVGMTPSDLFPPESGFAEIWREFYLSTLEHGVFSTEYEVFTKNKMLSLSFNLLKKDGNTFGISVFGKDVTEQKRAEKQIKLNEARLESLLRINQHPARSIQEFLDFALEEVITLTESKIGYIYLYNEESREFTLNTWSKEVMSQCSVMEKHFVYQLDKTGIWGEAVRQRKPIIVNDFAAPNELKRGLPEGHAPIRRFLTIPVFSDDIIVAVVGVANKVEEYDDADRRQITLVMDAVWKMVIRRRSEEALRVSEERYRRAEQIGMVGNWEYFPDKNLFWGSQGACRLFGIGAEAGYYPYNVISECIIDNDTVQKNLHDLIRTGKPFDQIVQIIQKSSGQKRTLHLIGNLVTCTESENVKVIGVLQDITERKRTESALFDAQKHQALAVLSGGIAHDFNNILGGIIGYAEMSLDETSDNSLLQKNLNQILKAAERAKDLVQQILYFSRQDPEDSHPLYIQPVIKEVVQLLRASLPATIELRCNHIKEEAPMYGDTSRIHEIIMNLCINAAYAMDNKGILEVYHEELEIGSNIHCSIGRIKSGLYSVIGVKDSGCGISKDVLPHIFEPYFTTKPVGKGNGLGLSVVSGIVLSYGGAILVESETGKGAAFKVYLPKIKDCTAFEKKEYKSIRGGRERILYIDDESTLCDVASIALGNIGYKVKTFTDSQMALQEFKTNTSEYDLIITDQTMPGITGIELSTEFLRIRPDIPIILCTGYSSSVDEKTAKATGIREFLLKPLRKMDIAQKIRDVLDDE